MKFKLQKLGYIRIKSTEKCHYYQKATANYNRLNILIDRETEEITGFFMIPISRDKCDRHIEQIATDYNTLKADVEKLEK